MREAILSLGWKDRHRHQKDDPMPTYFIEEKNGRWLLSFPKSPDEDGIYNMVMISWVDADVDHNEWENSDPAFYGIIKTPKDLEMVMRLTGVIDY
jgi:hypothetical protein